MPQPFENAVITNAGARLLTRAQAGEASIEFTRIAVGDGAYSAEEKTLDAMQDRTALKSLKNSYPLSGVEIINDHCVKITALITNRDPAGGQALVTTGYHINEMGLFAREKDADGDTEVLYSVTVTTGENGDFMPPYNGYNPAQITQEYYATVSNAAEVTIRIVDAGAALLVEDAEREFSRIDAEIEGIKQGTAEVMTGATESKDGTEGLAPAPGAGKADRYLRSDGMWVSSGEQTLEFTAASERTKITSGEKRSSILGKIVKWFSDLKAVAFSGNYKDLTGAPTSLPANGGNADSVGGKSPADLQNYNNLSNKPIAMKNPNALTFTGAASGTYDGSAAKTVNIPSAPAVMTGATSSAAGTAGLVPAPPQTSSTLPPAFLTNDGTWSSVSIRGSSGSHSVLIGRTRQSEASGENSVGFGGQSVKVAGPGALGGGYGIVANGTYSAAIGVRLGTNEMGQTQFGICGVTDNTKTFADSAFSIGNGSNPYGVTTHSCAFRVTGTGTPYGQGAYQSSGADYAEFFELIDGNPDNEDLRGYFVTLEGGKIRKAAEDDDYILGVISAKPVIIGNSDPDNWHGRFLKDEFGCYVMRRIVDKVPAGHDENGEEIFEEMEREVHIQNPDFDESRGTDYVSREKRPEWQPVGMLGQLIVRDDGTCRADEYCTASNGGIATHSDFPGWRVTERVNDYLVKIIFK